MKNLIKCHSCRCKPVCKECSNFELYVKQYLESRKNSVLFDKDPECPYYIENEGREIKLPEIRTVDDWIKDFERLGKGLRAERVGELYPLGRF